MTCCDHCTDMKSVFDEKSARKQLRKYNKGSTDSATSTLIQFVRPLTTHLKHRNGTRRTEETHNGNVELSLLDIGGGIGAIALELFNEGITRVTNVDASPGYQLVAREAAATRNVADRITFVGGDFLDVARDVQEHDIVTLDKVVCCYPNVTDLVRASAQRARTYYVLCYPRNNWMSRLWVGFVVVTMKIRRSAFRPYIHSDETINDVVVGEGFALINEVKLSVWQVRVWERQTRRV